MTCRRPHHEKRGTSFRRGEIVDVVTRLLVGFFKGDVPLGGAADPVAGAGGSIFLQKGGLSGAFLFAEGPLLGLQNKAATLVKVGKDGRLGAVPLFTDDGPLKNVGIKTGITRRSIRARNLKHIAQLEEEGLVVGPLRAAGLLPLADEDLDRFQSDRWGIRHVCINTVSGGIRQAIKRAPASASFHQVFACRHLELRCGFGKEDGGRRECSTHSGFGHAKKKNRSLA